MKKTILLYISLAIALAVMWKVYYPNATPSSPWGNLQSGMRGEIEEKYVLITNESGASYWMNAFKGFEDAADLLNVSVEYLGTATYDAQEQATVLEQVIAKKPAGIAIAAIDDPRVKDMMNKAVEAGIPIVQLDAKIDFPKAMSFIGTDQVQAGGIAIHQLVSAVKGAGELAVITNPNRAKERSRIQGILEELNQIAPAQHLIQIPIVDGSHKTARIAVNAALDQHPTITGIVSTNTEGGIGAAEAAVYFKKKNIKIVTFDSDVRTLDMIKQGAITSSVEHGTWNMGYWALQFLFQKEHHFLNEEEYDARNIPLLPGDVLIQTSIIDAKNVNNFYEN
jgi:ribose transport system substrate-binding protein